jgi:hypothetical protein
MPNNITINSGSSRRLIVTSQPKNRILINNQTGATGGPGTIDTIVELKDVDATDIDSNETLVYDGESGKFVVKELPIINGGTF